MIKKIKCLILVALMGTSHSQETAGCSLRFTLHDPINPVADLYVKNAAGEMEKIPFLPQALSQPMAVLPQDQTLLLYSKPEIDPKEPLKNLAARCELACRRGMIVVIPAAPKSKLPYLVFALDDDSQNFGKGESRVLNVTQVEMAAEFGGAKYAIHPGKFSAINKVTKVNEFNMGQANFYYKHDDAWVLFSERQLQFLDNTRRLFIVYTTPGSTVPFLLTIADHAPTIIPATP